MRVHWIHGLSMACTHQLAPRTSRVITTAQCAMLTTPAVTPPTQRRRRDIKEAAAQRTMRSALCTLHGMLARPGSSRHASFVLSQPTCES